MVMSYIKIMVHVVWATKNREPILVKEKRELLFDHIRNNAKSKDIYIDCIGGYSEHVHCLISIGADQSIAKIVQLLKGESSFWSNKEGLFKTKLEWANEYFAASVSYMSAQKVRDYIMTQEDHHRKITFAEEYQKFIEGCGIDLAKAGSS